MSASYTYAIGDICRLVNLKNDAELNGKGCTIHTPLVENEVPEHLPTGHKLVKAQRYGIALFTGETGYIKPENLELVASVSNPAMIRAAWIHFTGQEPPKERV